MAGTQLEVVEQMCRTEQGTEPISGDSVEPKMIQPVGVESSPYRRVRLDHTESRLLIQKETLRITLCVCCSSDTFGGPFAYYGLSHDVDNTVDPAPCRLP